jgi:hypothetical protein
MHDVNLALILDDGFDAPVGFLDGAERREGSCDLGFGIWDWLCAIGDFGFWILVVRVGCNFPGAFNSQLSTLNWLFAPPDF